MEQAVSRSVAQLTVDFPRGYGVQRLETVLNARWAEHDHWLGSQVVGARCIVTRPHTNPHHTHHNPTTTNSKTDHP